MTIDVFFLPRADLRKQIRKGKGSEMTIDVFFLPRADLRKQRRRASTFDKCGLTSWSGGGSTAAMARALRIQRPKPESRGSRGGGKPGSRLCLSAFSFELRALADAIPECVPLPPLAGLAPFAALAPLAALATAAALASSIGHIGCIGHIGHFNQKTGPPAALG